MEKSIKIIFCLTRKKGLSREEFQDYWRNIHADKVSAVAKDIGMVRYLQCHSFDTPMNAALANARGGLEGYDGVMEGYWNSEEEALSFLGSDAGKAGAKLLLDDEAKFIDFARSPVFMTREHVIY